MGNLGIAWGQVFAHLLGLELKGAIVSRGMTANAIADTIGVGRATLNRYLNGRLTITVPVFVLACEAVGVQPAPLVERAYDRWMADGAGVAREAVPASSDAESDEPPLRPLVRGGEGPPPGHPEKMTDPWPDGGEITMTWEEFREHMRQRTQQQPPARDR